MNSLPVTRSSNDFVPSPSIVPIDRKRSSQLFDVTPVNEVDVVDILHCGSSGNDLEVSEVLNFLNESGFRESDKDPRLEHLFTTLSERSTISLGELTALKRNNLMVQKALHSELAIPDFRQFTSIVERIFEETKSIEGGSLASYIPQLASVDPNLWGVSVCTVDGQRFSIGDSGTIFSVQSVSKPISYAIALETCGKAKVHAHVGMEPSGRNFNERVLLPSGIPHNPLINTGAIMTASLLFKGKPRWQRFEQVAEYWRRLGGTSTAPEILTSTFLAERETANRNFCLAHMMAETPGNLFPSDLPGITSVLDDYFSYCSLGVNTEMMSVVAATLANGGVNPITDERVLSSSTVTSCLSVMMTCGMYDASGEFSATTGFPAKSGVSGIIMAVIPGVCGICTYAPQIDGLGNSVKGLNFFARLAREAIGTPLYRSPSQTAVLTAFGNQFDWRTSGKESVLTKFSLREYSSLWWASANGDELRIRQLAARGININETNYSGRNAMNFAISRDSMNGLSVVQLLVSLGINTSADALVQYLDDAAREGRQDIYDYLMTLDDERVEEQLPRTYSHPLSLGNPERIPVQRFFAGKTQFSPIDALVAALDDCGLYYEPHMPSMDEPVFPMRELYVRALCGKLIIPNWVRFSAELRECLEFATSGDSEGGTSPEVRFAATSSDSQRIELKAVDGCVERVSRGSPANLFPIDGIVRLILYEFGLDLLGKDRVHKFIGREPSGQPETSLRTNADNLPYNPLTMSGCLTLCHHLLKVKTIPDIIGMIRERLGLGFTAAAAPVHSRQYIELTKCVQNLLSSMDETGGEIASLTPLTLELFFQAHSMMVDVQCLADYARSIAKSRTDSSSLLSLMYSCGLDEVSGEWSFRFGLPARSCFNNGCVIVVIPGVLGYAIRSKTGGKTLAHSISQFQRKFDEKFNFHLFKRHFMSLDCNDPTLFFGSNKLLLVTQFIAAAFNGDISTMKHILAEGLDVNSTDMDGRTALHVATAVGNMEVCQWLIRKGANPDIQDRWGILAGGDAPDTPRNRYTSHFLSGLPDNE